jgi:DNA-binding Lrp family transcriptional regulator
MDGFVLVHAEVGTARRVTDAMLRVNGVVRAEMVTGPYDVIAMVEARDERDLESHVLGDVEAIPGVIRAVVCPRGPYHLGFSVPTATAVGQ